MKHIFKFLLLMLELCAGLISANAQAGLQGQVYDYEQRWLCDSATATTFYRLDVHRPGQAAVTIGNYKPDGSSYTPTSTILSGPCTSGGSYPDSTYQYLALEHCDWATGTGGTPYFVLIRIGTKNSTGATQRSYLGTFNATTGAAYTITGTPMDGYCAGYADKLVTNLQYLTATNTTGVISTPNAKHSIEIMNIGTVKGTVTVNSTTIDLYPGTKWYCWSQLDPVSNELLGCPSINYDCSTAGSTTFLIVRKGD